MSRTEETRSGEVVRLGLAAYAQVIHGAGGTEVEALVRGGDRSSVGVAIYASPKYDLQVPSLPVSRLTVNLTGGRVTGAVESDRRLSYQTARGAMFLMPAGARAAWSKESPSRHLTVYFPPGALSAEGDHGPAFDAERPLLNAQVAGTRHLADQITQELCEPDALSAEAVDGLAWLMLIRVARHMGARSTASGAITPRVMALLRSYVQAHMADRILVADLAREAGLAPTSFARAFSEQAGQSPHRFVLAMRLERAAELLRSSVLSLVDIANECGFSDQQHLCHAMRRHKGITPSRLRERGRGVQA